MHVEVTTNILLQTEYKKPTKWPNQPLPPNAIFSKKLRGSVTDPEVAPLAHYNGHFYRLVEFSVHSNWRYDRLT